MESSRRPDHEPPRSLRDRKKDRTRRMIQAEAMYIMGRTYHEQNDFSRADQYYNSSIGLADQ